MGNYEFIGGFLTGVLACLGLIGILWSILVLRLASKISEEERRQNANNDL